MRRNKDAILEVLKQRLPPAASGTVLEVASGTGQHAAHFSAALPHLAWQPTEPSPDTFFSIEAWAADAPSVLPPVLLDCAAPAADWPLAPASCLAVLCVNMTHISPFTATQGLFAGAGKVLQPGGVLILYGPFKVEGQPTTESNRAFDSALRAQNAAWGLRDVSEIDACADAAGLRRSAMLPMPANNFSLVYEKAGGGGSGD